MGPVRVLYDHEIFTRQSRGGISRYFVELIKAFRAEEVSAKVLAPFHANSMLRDLPANCVRGIDVVTPRFYNVKAPFFFINHAINRLQGLGEAADIVHETYYAPRANFGKKWPVVVTIHDFVHEHYPELFKKTDNSIELKRKAISRADHLICISENTKRDLERFYPNLQKPISVIYHGVQPPIHFDQANLNQQKPFVLYVGSRMAYKNFSVLLNAFAQSNLLKSGFDLVAFGGGPFSESEKAQIHRLGLASLVKQRGGNDFELAQAYRTAAALVYPSLYEGFGFPPLEAMSYGCPVIASNASCLPEVLADGASFFNPLEAEELISCLLRLANDPSFRSHLIAKANKHIAQFTWRATAEQTQQVYRSL